MKTIQIPMYSNPFTVVINNSVYQYKAGESVEVPDEVAAAIEDALKLEPKPKRYFSKFAQRADGTIEEITEKDLEGISIVYAYTFFHSGNLQRVSIPDSVATIGYSAFFNCQKLVSVTIGKGVTEIRGNAFADCTALKRITLRALTPPVIYTESFTNVSTECVFEVPPEALEAYRSAQQWSSFANQIVAIEE